MSVEVDGFGTIFVERMAAALAHEADGSVTLRFVPTEPGDQERLFRVLTASLDVGCLHIHFKSERSPPPGQRH
jgi:hypothetical protein